jgi:peptidoglycan/xylan/chitin deacetylase (PgdA/CDA1 family)
MGVVWRLSTTRLAAIVFAVLVAGCAAASTPPARPTAVLLTVPSQLDNPSATRAATRTVPALAEATPTVVGSTTIEPLATSTMRSVQETVVAQLAPTVFIATQSPSPLTTIDQAPPTRSPTAPPAAPTPPPAPPLVPVSSDEVVRGAAVRPWVSLVFNVGAGYTPATAILDTLRARGVHTTFFLMGWWVDKQPAIVRRIAADGHEIASHGYEIFDLTQASDSAVIADLNRADRSIASITGHSTRPLWMPSAGYRDARVRSLAASIGFRPIYWTLDSGDWQVDATAAGVKQRVLAGAENGAIIVMHFDSSRTANTIAATLPSIIDGLRGQGYRLVTISELISGQLRSGSGS